MYDFIINILPWTHSILVYVRYNSVRYSVRTYLSEDGIYVRYVSSSLDGEAEQMLLTEDRVSDAATYHPPRGSRQFQMLTMSKVDRRKSVLTCHRIYHSLNRLFLLYSPAELSTPAITTASGGNSSRSAHATWCME